MKLRAAAQTTTEWEIRSRVEWGSSCVSKETLKAIVDVAYWWSGSWPSERVLDRRGNRRATGRLFFESNESEMVGFDSRSGSQRSEAQTTESPRAAAMEAPCDSMRGKTVKQRLDSMDGVVQTEATAGNAIAVAIDTRNSGLAELRAAGLMIDTEAEPVGSKVALEEAMQDEPEAFHFAARTNAVHITTGVIINE